MPRDLEGPGRPTSEATGSPTPGVGGHRGQNTATEGELLTGWGVSSSVGSSLGTDRQPSGPTHRHTDGQTESCARHRPDPPGPVEPSDQELDLRGAHGRTRAHPHGHNGHGVTRRPLWQTSRPASRGRGWGRQPPRPGHPPEPKSAPPRGHLPEAWPAQTCTEMPSTSTSSLEELSESSDDRKSTSKMSLPEKEGVCSPGRPTQGLQGLCLRSGPCPC